MRRLILAAALAAASLSFAPAFADDNGATYGTGPDNPGVDDLGIDISGVNLSPSGVHAFLASQTPEVRERVRHLHGPPGRRRRTDARLLRRSSQGVAAPIPEGEGVTTLPFRASRGTGSGTLALRIGAQERTRTFTPCGTRT
jgi:hypothetical protein